MDETTTDQLDALIIRNLDQLEIAAHRMVHDIEPAIGQAVNAAAEKWAKSNKWDGEFRWWSEKEEESLWVAPRSWKTNDGQLAAFHLDGEGNDTLNQEREEDIFWITRLCQKGRGGLGLRWWSEGGLGATPSRWKRFARDNQGLVSAIGKQGFIIEESGLFFLKVSIEANSLVDAMLAGKVDGALQPLRLALGRVASAPCAHQISAEILCVNR